MNEYNLMEGEPLESEYAVCKKMNDTATILGRYRGGGELQGCDINHPNSYHLGSIAGHNLVIASQPRTGNVPAATVITNPRRTFENVRYAGLVGIGGGVPIETDNGPIRLGHVIVGSRYPNAVVQHYAGKAETGQFRSTGFIPPPPDTLLNVVTALASQRTRSREDVPESNIRRIDTTNVNLRKYKYPGRENDHLYKAGYIHRIQKASCSGCDCDPSERVNRARDADEPNIHCSSWKDLVGRASDQRCTNMRRTGP